MHWLAIYLLVQAFNLRPTVSGKSNDTTGSTANVKVTAILEKANAIRQVLVTLLLLSITLFPNCVYICILYLISIHNGEPFRLLRVMMVKMMITGVIHDMFFLIKKKNISYTSSPLCFLASWSEVAWGFVVCTHVWINLVYLLLSVVQFHFIIVWWWIYIFVSWIRLTLCIVRSQIQAIVYKKFLKKKS